MTVNRYNEWFSRGRSHQTEGRPIDAMLCYRRALREASDDVDGPFHLAEIAWQLGAHSDAIVTWQAIAARRPNHGGTLRALAEALAVHGRFDEASDVAQRALALDSNDARIRSLLMLVHAAAGHLASDVDLAGAIRGSRTWPLRLLAAVGIPLCARASDYADSLTAVVDAADAAVTAAPDVDEVRRLASAAANARLDALADRLADRYARGCDALYGAMMPLRLPVRTSGVALRVGFVVVQAQDAGRIELIDHLRARLSDAFRATTFVSAEARAAGSDDAAVRVLPADPDIAARGIASLDLDVLIDFAGVRMPSGPIFARHPARLLWGMRTDGVPVAATLLARVFAEDQRDALTDALLQLNAAVISGESIDLDAMRFDQRWNAAVEAHRAGENEKALAGYEGLIRIAPAYVPALYLRGVLARAMRDVDVAHDRLQVAVREAPRFVDARVALADVAVMRGESEAAAAIVREGIERDKNSPTLWRALGHAELAQRDAVKAIAAFSKALELDQTHAETHYNHGVALQMARRSSDAARAYQRALALRADFVDAEFNLGVVFDQQGQSDAAIAAFSNVLKRAPTHARAYKALADLLLTSGRLDAWVGNCTRFEQYCPDHAALAPTALEVCAYQANFARLDEYLRGLESGRYTQGETEERLDALQQLLYLLHFFDIEPPLLGRLARAHDALARRFYGEPRPKSSPRRPGRIRVGYLSGDFRNHVMGKMMYEALRHHERERFDIFGYATSETRDAWTVRYEDLFGKLATVATVSDEEAATRIAEDDLDILVDLSTHTKGARPGILARKPARVQITHVATAGTLGMSAIDYKLTDRYADPAFDPTLQIEPLLVMEGCVYPYRHIEATRPSYTRDDLEIPADAVVIAAFVTPLKLSQRCLVLWREILQRLPKAIIAFSPLHPALRTVFQQVCNQVGIDASRIAFFPQGRDDGENQGRYALVDFVLDPMPYGGVNGTLEALDMGVPVVALIGKRHAERTSYSILRNLGVTETIAGTAREYVEIAVRLATDSAFMRDVRARIRAGLDHSPLTDMRAHTRHLENAYLSALEERAPEVLRDVRRVVEPSG